MKIANRIVMAIASAVLLFASYFKIEHVLTKPIITEGFWESREFYIIQIPLVTGLAIWLVCGIFRKAGWLLGVLAFLVFCADTIYKLASGAASCGCFGTVEVDPKVTLFAINIPMLILLLVFRPKGEKLLPPPWPKFDHFVGCALPTFLLLGTIVGVTWHYEPAMVTEDYQVVDEQGWVGQRLPMLDYIDVGYEMEEGLWVVLFYHWDCPECREAIPVYNEFNEMLMGNEQAIRFAFVEIPPYGTPENDPIPEDTNCLLGKLDERKKWYAGSPVLFVIQDGIVLNGWQLEVPLELDVLLGETLGM